jgi:hypothetical protein
MAAETVNSYYQRIRYDTGVSVLLEGDRGDLTVTLDTPLGYRVLNEISPEGTRFNILDHAIYGVTSNVDRRSVGIPRSPDDATRRTLPYEILNGMARLRLHEDPSWHETSVAAHDLLNHQLIHLQAYGKVQRPTSIDEIRAWEVIGREERRTAELTLEALRDLRAQGIEPMPQAQKAKDLARVVNSPYILRTARQIVMNPKWLGEQIELPITLPEYWVAAVMQ